ncbi:MAG: iron-sulfur cluster assembly scaffold protein [Candidatus Rokubacteria bacterium]|nr:iron-sulfur cluster assembly scaffold protein [Candidatus Rokubacteria bacterium]
MTPAAGPRPLYSDVIRERWRRPRFRGDLPGANAVAEDVNPLCGDRVRMLARVAGGEVRAARFTGDSCAICTASADVLAEMAEGRTVEATARLGVSDVLDVLGTDVRPTRLRCVSLPIDVLTSALGLHGDRGAPRLGRGAPSAGGSGGRPEPPRPRP